VGIDNLVDSSIIEIDNHFTRAFFFSTQTLTTLGYGQMSPTGLGANIIASLEAFIGLLMFALLTGLLYGRFSKPKAKLIFSKNALVAPYKETEKGLMFRLANAKRSTITNVAARVVMSYVVTHNKDKVRKYFNLPLELDKISLLTTSWTIVHPLNDESPIVQLKKEDLEMSDVELIIQIEGFDETYNQQVSTRTSYVFSEIIFNAKFKRILHHDENGLPYINLGELSAFEEVN
jgi:inward rectifier potassium channel